MHRLDLSPLPVRRDGTKPAIPDEFVTDQAVRQLLIGQQQVEIPYRWPALDEDFAGRSDVSIRP